MAHILFKVGVKRTQLISGFFVQASRFGFGSPAASKAIYTKQEAGGIAEGGSD